MFTRSIGRRADRGAIITMPARTGTGARHDGRIATATKGRARPHPRRSTNPRAKARPAGPLTPMARQGNRTT